jgi:hypothetical protein
MRFGSRSVTSMKMSLPNRRYGSSPRLIRRRIVLWFTPIAFAASETRRRPIAFPTVNLLRVVIPLCRLVTFGRMSDRTARRHRMLKKLGRSVVTAGQHVRGRNRRLLMVAGRRNAQLAALRDKELLGFAESVLACVESKQYTSSPQSRLVEMELKTYKDGEGKWRRASQLVRDRLKETTLPAALLAVAAWDVVPALIYGRPHGNRAGARGGLKLGEGGTPWERLGKHGRRLSRWAWGIAPMRQGSRRSAPPCHLLNLSKRMICYWRHHKKYESAVRYIRGVIRDTINN